MNNYKDLPDAPWIAEVERFGIPDDDVQEAKYYIPQIGGNSMTWWYTCGNCGRPVDRWENRCSFCEGRIIWDE